MSPENTSFRSMIPMPIPGRMIPRGPVALPVPKHPVVAANPVKNQAGEPLQDLFEFHCRVKLTDNLNEVALANSNCDEVEDGEIYSPVTRMVINLDGVAELRLDPYKLIVRKATLYSWDELAPKILEILKTWYNTRRSLQENLVITPGETPREESRQIFQLPPGTGLKELGLEGETNA